VIAVEVASLKRFAHRHFALLAYVLLYLVIVLFILPPTGEALLTDDCDYSITVFNWLQTGRLQLSDFPSMTLIGHLGWGAAFAKVFGSNQIALRASTMVMVWLGGLAIYALAIAHQRSTNFAAFCAATYVFNPFFLFYAYTFNTDVAGCSTMLMFLALAQKTGNTRSILPWIGLGTMAGICFLIRQTAAIPAIWYAAVLTYFVVTRQLHWLKLAIFGSAFVMLPAAYFFWLHFARDWPLGYEKRFLVFWQFFHVKIMAVKLARMSLAVALYTLPLSLACMRFQSKHVLRWGVAFLGLLACSFAFYFVDMLKPVRPYWSQEFYDCGFGKKPEVLGLDAWIQSPRLVLPLGEVSVFDLFIVPLSLLSLFVWFYLIGKRIKLSSLNLQSLQPGSVDSQRLILGLTFASQWFLIVAVWDVFDRYFMPAIAIALVLLTVWLLTDKLSLKWCNAILLVTTVLGLLAIQDSRCQNEAAWKLAKHLGSRGIAPDRIWIGHQFFGTHVYLPEFYRRLESAKGDVRSMDRSDRQKLLGRPENIQFRIIQCDTRTISDSAIARLKFSSWIRSYEFFAIPIVENGVVF
jgi:hypothetical protein